uniref:dihydropyrimidinase n=1 Tax=Strigamia maritima TaxID=126957 RepID=T1IR18_STRMM
MDSSQRSSSPTHSVAGSISSIASIGSGNCNPNRPRLKSSFFGVIPDAFDAKSLSLGQASPARKGRVANGTPSVTSETSQPEMDEVMSHLEFNGSDGPVVEEVMQAKQMEIMSAEPIIESAHNRLLLKGGKIVNDDQMVDGDVYVEDGIIKQVGRDLTIPGGTKILDVRGKLVIPGGIDTHTQFQTASNGVVSVDDFYQGTKAALAGGTTMIVNTVIENRNTSILEAYEKWRSWADEKACCDYGLQVTIPSWSPKTRKEMETLTQEKGVSAFRLFTSNKDEMMLNDEEMCQAMESIKDLGGISNVHCGNGTLVAHNEKKFLSLGITGPEGHQLSYSEDIEADSANHAITIAAQVNCPVIISDVMSKSTADVITKKRQQGAIAFGEPIAASLGTDGTHYYNKCWNHCAAHVMSPPLRLDPTTPAYLMDFLASGDLYVTGSAHCTFSSTQKSAGQNDFTKIPNGVNGVEDRMSIIWEKGVMTGKLDPCQFVAVTSTNAAKLFNVYPRKGRIAVGSDADVVVWDGQSTRAISVKSHHQKVDFNIFEGMQCHGVPYHVIANGRLVMEEGALRACQGAGRFVAMPTFSPHIYMRVQGKDKALLPCVIDREPSNGPVVESPMVAATNGVRLQESMPFKSSPICFDLPIPGTPMSGLPVSSSPMSASPGSVSSMSEEFHQRPPTRGGHRNLQDSSFSLSGAQFDDAKSPRPGIRVNNPPGGKSTALW